MQALPILVFAAAGLFAQSFEVTSVRVNQSGDGSSNGPYVSKGKLVVKNVPMRRILQVAWGLQGQQIIGPAWIDSERFDMAGTSPPGVPDAEIKPMLQALLKDRFHLVTHLEKRELPVYNMVVSKDGLKIKPFDPSNPPGNPTRMAGASSMIVGAVPMADLAGALSGPSGRPVVDRTGLQGRYYYAVQFSCVRRVESHSL